MLLSRELIDDVNPDKSTGSGKDGDEMHKRRNSAGTPEWTAR